MKRTLTPLALVFLVLFAFGQKADLQKHEFSGSFPAGIKSSLDLRKADHANHGTRMDPKVWLKSSQETKQRLDSMIVTFWNEESGQYEKVWKDEYTYDENGNLTVHFFCGWDDEGGGWGTGGRVEFTYDDGGNLILEVEYDWDDSQNQWITSEKFESTYDDEGKITATLGYDWDVGGSQWLLVSKREYTYDNDGRLSYEISYQWDESGSSWLNEWKFEYTYDVYGNLVLENDFHWDPDGNQWIASWRHEYIYDAGNFLWQEYDYEWVTETSQWVPNWKQEYIYDEVNVNLEQTIEYMWDTSVNNWVNDGMAAYSYDNAYISSEIIAPFWMEEMMGIFNHMLLSITHHGWDEENGEWVVSYMAECSYSELEIGSVQEPRAVLAKIFPNPATDCISFTLTGDQPVMTFELFNQGLIVLSKEVRNNERISLEGLADGFYVYRISTGKGDQQSGKLIKR